MNKRWEFKADGFVYCKATGERVCSPHSTLPDSIKPWKSHKQDLKANARLICAAPELLEALKAMLTHMGMDEDEWNNPTFDQARAAVAKAEGENHERS